MADEIWKDIKESNGLYQISNLGRVRQVKIISPTQRMDGYYSVTLKVNNKWQSKLVHRLVADAFIDNILNKKEVNHIDGNKQNNKQSNLEWVTAKENRLHAIKTGLHYMIKVRCLETGEIYNSCVDAGKSINIKSGNEHIKECCLGIRNTCGGYHWEFIKEDDLNEC